MQVGFQIGVQQPLEQTRRRVRSETASHSALVELSSDATISNGNTRSHLADAGVVEYIQTPMPQPMARLSNREADELLLLQP